MTLQGLYEITMTMIDKGVDPNMPVEIYDGEDPFTGDTNYVPIHGVYLRVGKIIIE